MIVNVGLQSETEKTASIHVQSATLFHVEKWPNVTPNRNGE